MCTSLHTVTLNQGLRTIFRSAFAMCFDLREIDIPSSVETIEEEAFSSCRSMRSVVLREGLITIGHKAVAHCESLLSIAIPSTVYSLGNAAFQGCESLVDVQLQEGLAGIGISTFAHCHSISSISFPQSLMVLLGTAFVHCSNLLGFRNSQEFRFDHLSRRVGLSQTSLLFGLRRTCELVHSIHHDGTGKFWILRTSWQLAHEPICE